MCLVGGLVALRINPGRPLLACCIAPIPVLLQLAGLALAVPVAVLAAAAFVASIGLSIHLTLWFTVFQQQVPEHAQSRVSSYDALGSFVLTPLGTGIAGPVAAGLGTPNALWLAVGAILTLNTSMLLIPSVWAIRRPEA